MFSTSNKTTEDNSAKPIVKPQTNGTASSIVNIIGQGTSIQGEIMCDGDIRIDGMVKGTVTSKSKIVIGSTGSVDGDIICDNADISGKIFGTVEVNELLFLKASSYIEGNITTGKLVVETGAKFNGSCRMGVKEMKPNDKLITPAPAIKKKPFDSSAYGRYSSIGFQMIAAVAIGFGIGYFADNFFDLSIPLFKVLFSFSGVIAALYFLLKEINRK